MPDFVIKRSYTADATPKVIVEFDGRVIADLETLSARHAELVSYDLAMLATRIDPEAEVVVSPPLEVARCQPAWGRTRQLLATNTPGRC